MQQCRCRLVLHKEMGHGMQLFAEPVAVRFEEEGFRLENQRDVEQGNASLFQGSHVIEPKIVLNEEGRHEMMALQPLFGVKGRVGRQIQHLVGQGIVFAHLVARRREKREQYPVMRKLFFDGLDDRTTLLKLAQRRSMKPNPVAIARRRGQLGPPPDPELPHLPKTPLNQQPGFGVAEQSGNAHAKGIE